ncbi:hypothetical protein VC83_03108 [Pseudogymnoascus destructans]|uniref:Uncharacterized protein n=1 Tax=Pseudogymnoascus destructans TaxID=655981 RepID=A0A177AFG3_9PEZI|nr:uncharacterized protein VC83_03108 [Pseudogymnoascus destructans]OAF59913.1 hypothetical protein VC83_03108 [Pseudogymnoascus destructans]
MAASEKRQWVAEKSKGKRLFAPELGGSYEVFNKRPLQEEMALYCTQDVKLMPKLWQLYSSRILQSWAKRVEIATKDRIAMSQTSGYDGKGMNRHLGPWFNQLSVNINAKISSLADEWNANLNHKEVVFIPTDESVFPGHRYCDQGKTAMPIGTIETIIQRIRKLVCGRADGMPNSLESMVVCDSDPSAGD